MLRTSSYSFAGSDELAAQIKAGARPDVYAAANTKLPDELYSDGLVEKPVPFATNTLVIAVPADAKDKVKSLDDLAQPGVTIAAGSETVPVGSYTRKVLAKLPPAQEQAILDEHQVERARRCRGGGKGVAGRSRCGLRLRDGRQGCRRQAAGGLDSADLQPTVVYGAAVVKGTKHHDQASAVRRRPHEWLRSGRPARRRLRAAAEELTPAEAKACSSVRS